MATAAHQAVPVQRVDLAYVDQAKIDWSQYSWHTPEVLVPTGRKQLRARRGGTRRPFNRLGNLTLITASLNSAVSNGPWIGETGKRALLEKHDVLLMNRRIREVSADGWTEQLIASGPRRWSMPWSRPGPCRMTTSAR